jgi:heme O synthase-like polyprenyltransferase
MLPAMLGLSGWWSAIGAFVVGLVYLRAAGVFYRDVSDRTARLLLRTSFLYLPVLLVLLVVHP